MASLLARPSNKGRTGLCLREAEAEKVYVSFLMEMKANVYDAMRCSEVVGREELRMCDGRKWKTCMDVSYHGQYEESKGE